MHSPPGRHLLVFLLLTVGTVATARAEEGALSLDLTAGGTLVDAVAPYATQRSSVLGFTPSFQLGARYALRTGLEVNLDAFYELPGTYYNHGITIANANGSFPGVLTYQLQRFGALAGVRLQTGVILRLVLGAEAGWSHRIFTRFADLDTQDPSNVTNYDLALPDLAQDNLDLAPYGGIEWCLGDHWSFSLLPRFELLVGQRSTWSVTLPLSFHWSFYL